MSQTGNKAISKKGYAETSAGLSSAMQLVETSSTSSILGGTVELPVYILPTPKKPETEREETITETIKKIIRRHKETLDRLAE